MSYEEWLRGLEDSKMAVNNPDVRRNDPEEWACLSDEQRDIIQQWYMDELKRQLKNEKRAKEQEESKWMFGVCFLGAAVGMAEFSRGQHVTDPIFAGTCWAVLEVVGGVAVCGVIAWIGKAVSEWIEETFHSRAGGAVAGLLSIAIWALVVGAIFVR